MVSEVEPRKVTFNINAPDIIKDRRSAVKTALEKVGYFWRLGKELKGKGIGEKNKAVAAVLDILTQHSPSGFEKLAETNKKLGLPLNTEEIAALKKILSFDAGSSPVVKESASSPLETTQPQIASSAVTRDVVTALAAEEVSLPILPAKEGKISSPVTALPEQLSLFDIAPREISSLSLHNWICSTGSLSTLAELQ